MNITITDKDVAESIATEVQQATGLACEVFSNDTSSVILCDYNTAIARITPLSSVIDVAPLYGPFVDDITSIPLTVNTFKDMKETTHALDTATSHILNAALNR